MNGGRLSDDETFLLGLGELRAQLAASGDGRLPALAAAEAALTRIGMRYPDEADQLRELWHVPEDAPAPLVRALDRLEAEHQADSDDD